MTPFLDSWSCVGFVEGRVARRCGSRNGDRTYNRHDLVFTSTETAGMPMSMTQRTDAELVAETHAGDVGAFGELYERRWETVVEAAQRVTGNRENAQDVASKVFADVFEGALSGGFVASQPSLKPLLRTAAKHQAIDIARRSAKLTVTDAVNVLDGPDDTYEVSDPGAGAGAHIAMLRAFANLSARDQELLQMRLVRRIPPRDLVRVFGISANAISQGAKRALANLRREYFYQRRAAADAAAGCTWGEAVLGLIQDELSEAQRGPANDHIRECSSCKSLHGELAGIPSKLRVVGLPLLLALRRGRDRLRLVAAEAAEVPSAAVQVDAEPFTEVDPSASPPASRGGPSPTLVKLMSLPVVLLLVIGGTVGWQRFNEDRRADDQVTASAAPTTPSSVATAPGAGPTVTAAPGVTRPVGQFSIATVRPPQIVVYDAIAGQSKVTLSRVGDFGQPLAMLARTVTDDWVEVFLPVRPNGSTGWVKRGEVALEPSRFYIRVELRAARITLWEDTRVLLREPVAVGTASEPTPSGLFYVKSSVRPIGAPGTTGLCAVGSEPTVYFLLSGYLPNPPACANPSMSISTIENRTGSSRFDAQLGAQSTHGGIRISSEALTMLENTVPLGTPVEVVDA